jgi:23S rRNA-/tRNA-specific pseudouridylate synthase
VNSVLFFLFWVYLSQGTTGVLVLARTKALARELSQQFRARAIDKSYLALVVHGDDARSFFPAKEGLIDASLSFDDGRVRVQAAASLSDNGNGSGAHQALPVTELGPGGKAARTTWEALASSVSRSESKVWFTTVR